MIDFISRWTIFAQVQIDPNDLENLHKGNLGDEAFKQALKIVFGVLGAIAIIIVTVAGFQYVMSQGDPQATGKAKNTIIDALIGLLICIMAYSIINFVVTRV